MASSAPSVAFLIGAAGNLGVAIARALAFAGFHTALLDHDNQRLRENLGEFASNTDHMLLPPTDATDREALAAAAAEVVRRFGQIDACINAVGGFRAGAAVHETPAETWNEMLNLNLRTTLAAVHAVVPIMLRQKRGSIVTVAARAALAGGARMAAYAASKAAVLRVTESLAAELGSNGINVNCVLPGTLDTEQNRRDTPDADTSGWVAPAAVADVIAFLCSNAARAVHGAAVPVLGRGRQQD
jgi:NAD(P)-dependent dehydrogenase (short-subunit alcohol dehydrogenase family)